MTTPMIAIAGQVVRQCMGGWCQVRESCAHFWAPQRAWSEPAENLCRELAQVAEPFDTDTLSPPRTFRQLSPKAGIERGAL